MTPEQLALITEWHNAKQRLAEAEAYERTLRTRVVNSMFGAYGDGTKTADIGNGYKLQNLNATRYDIADSPGMHQLVRNFTNFAETSEVGQKLVTYKPRLSLRAYKALPAWGKQLMDEHVTTTPQAPQLSIIAPKG